MNKRLLIILILCVGVGVAAAFWALRPQIIPLAVVSTSPANGAIQNPYVPVIITFNRALKENEIAVSVVPTTKTASSIGGNAIKITPETTFLPETPYTVSINTSPPYAFSFTTQTAMENSPGWNDASAKAFEQYQQKNASQDAALADIRTHAPIVQPGFTITYSYANNTYAVTLRAPYDQNKSAFLGWIKQKGVSDTSTLRIKYINQ
jgi:hypothetical protein